MSNNSPHDEEINGPSEAHLARKSTIGRLLKLIGCAMLIMVLVIVTTFWFLYRMATAEVPAYEAAIVATQDEAQVEKDRLSFESQITTVANEAQQPTDWQVIITQSEINAWLAEVSKKEIPEIEKAGLSEPRILLGDDSVTFAIRSNVGSTKGVVSIAVEPTVTDGGELALTILETKVGKLTLPTSQILQFLKEAQLEEQFYLRTKQNDGNWSVIINLVQLFDAEKMIPQLTGIDLRDGKILIQGKTEESTVAQPKKEQLVEQAN